MKLFPIACAVTSLAASATAAQVQPAAVAGTWDLTWQTRSGSRKTGWFLLVQSGAELRGEIHGQGSVKAKGKVSGQTFTLRGSRLAVPYTINGRVSGDRMEGQLKVLSVTRVFTGVRR
jgi:hypothetical protein